MQEIYLNYDSIKHKDYEFMKGVYSSTDAITNINYTVYLRDETNSFIDIAFDIDDESIYIGKKKKILMSRNNYIIKHKNYKIILNNPIIENDINKLDAEQIL